MIKILSPKAVALVAAMVSIATCADAQNASAPTMTLVVDESGSANRLCA
jgi:hypothetical protein